MTEQVRLLILSSFLSVSKQGHLQLTKHVTVLNDLMFSQANIF